MAVACQDVAHGIVSIRISSGTIRCAEKLPLIVIGIRHRTVGIGIGGDVAHAVVGVAAGQVSGQVTDTVLEDYLVVIAGQGLS